MTRVSIVVPALNEPHLPQLLNELSSYEVHVQTEKGLSYAVWKGIQHARGDVVAVMDADGSHPASAIKPMFSMLNEDVWFVAGSRYVKGGYSHDSIMRKVISLFYCIVARLILRTNIHDCMSGFWVGYRSKFNFEPTETYKFGLQLLRKYRGHIMEYPIVFEKRKSGKSKVKPIQAIKDLWEVISVAWKRMQSS